MYRYLLVICLILCFILPANAIVNTSTVCPSTTCKPTFVYVTVTVPPAAQPTPQIIYVPVPAVTQNITTPSPSILDKLPKNLEYIIYGLLFLSLIIGLIVMTKKKNKFLKTNKKILEVTTNIDELYEETPEPVEKSKPVKDIKPKKPKKPISLLDQDFEF